MSVSQLDRRVLLRFLAGGGLAGLTGIGASAAQRGIDSRLSRGYSRTAFGQVHHWAVGEGPVIIMVHQSAQSSAEYAAIAPLLAKDYRVVAIDLPGHGQSDTPDHELTCDEYADAVIAVMDNLGIARAHLAGHHGGGTVCFNLAIRYPGRAHKLVLSGVGRSADFDLQKALNTPMTRDLPLDADGDFLGRTWEVYRRMSAPDTPPEVTFQPFIVSLENRLRRYDMHYAMYRWDPLPHLDNFAGEALLLEGEHDSFAGDVSLVRDKLRNSTYKKVPGAAWLFYEYPAESAAAIRDFLS